MNQPKESSDLHIRLAVPEEAAAIASVLHQAFVEYAHMYTPEAFAATTPTAEQILKRWSEGPVWVTTRHAGVVGTVAARPADGAVYVRSMAILPTSRGRGIGRLLLDQVERYARKRDYQRLLLSTTPFLSRAIRLYEQFGFQRTTEGPHKLFGTRLFTMVKPLASHAQPLDCGEHAVGEHNTKPSCAHETNTGS